MAGLCANLIPRDLIVARRLLAAQAVAVLVLMATSEVAIESADLVIVIATIGVAALVAAVLRAGGRRRVPALIDGVSLLLLSGMATGCLTLLLTRPGAPLADDWLAAADVMLFPFLRWPDMIGVLAAHPDVMRAMSAIYLTLSWQPFALVALLVVLGRIGQLWQFATAWTITLMVCALTYALLPAFSPYPHYGFVRADLPGLTVGEAWHVVQLITDLRDGRLTQVGTASMTGMVTFPSFHAAGAVLLGWAFARVGPIGWPFVALNAAMLLTVPAIGSHYFVDIVAGVLLALTAIAAVRPDQNARATANSTASTIASLALPAANGPNASIAR